MIVVLGVEVIPATYKGKSVDGKKYAAVVKTSNGLVASVDVEFKGRAAFLYFEKSIIKVYIAKEEIEDPRNILAADSIRSWTIELRDRLD